MKKIIPLLIVTSAILTAVPAQAEDLDNDILNSEAQSEETSTHAVHAGGSLSGLKDQYRSSVVSKPEAHSWLFAHPTAPIVVLGARLNPDGSMPQILIDRLDETVKQAVLHPTNPIVVTGGYTQPAVGISEADAMYSYLVRNLVAPWRITKENQAGSTVGNAQFYYQLYPNVPGAVIITDSSHMARALRTFEAAAPKQTFKGLIVS